MIRVSPERQDALAEGLAKGLTARQAALRAGFGPRNDVYYRWLKLPEFMARVERHRRAQAPAGSADLQPVIERLLAAADKGAEATDGPTLRAVCDLLAEAARLKQLLPAPESEARPQNYEMTREAWLAAFAPKD
jgi:hypothetical protein